MHSVRAALTILVSATLVAAQDTRPAGAKVPPAIDKQKLAQYISYAEGFSPSVKISVDDPQPTALEGYYKVVVHLSLNDSKEEKTYHLTADGKHLVGDPLWDLTVSPFQETAALIPTDGPSFGPTGAKLTLVVFNDFQCPYCREFARTLRDSLPKRYPKEVRVVFKDFPIVSIHPWARAAAEAAHCVGDGKADAFWAFHDWVFEHQGEMQPGNVHEKALNFGKEHGLDPEKIGACIDSHATAAEVAANIKRGKELGVEQTPTFFLNGRKVPGAIPWKALDTLIQMELNPPSFLAPTRSGL
jgi:protein-disulfide isomerase